MWACVVWGTAQAATHCVCLFVFTFPSGCYDVGELNSGKTLPSPRLAFFCCCWFFVVIVFFQLPPSWSFFSLHSCHEHASKDWLKATLADLSRHPTALSTIRQLVHATVHGEPASPLIQCRGSCPWCAARPRCAVSRLPYSPRAVEPTRQRFGVESTSAERLLHLSTSPLLYVQQPRQPFPYAADALVIHCSHDRIDGAGGGAFCGQQPRSWQRAWQPAQQQ